MVNRKVALSKRLINSLCCQVAAFEREVNSFAGHRLIDPCGIAYQQNPMAI